MGRNLRLDAYFSNLHLTGWGLLFAPRYSNCLAIEASSEWDETSGCWGKGLNGDKGNRVLGAHSGCNTVADLDPVGSGFQDDVGTHGVHVVTDGPDMKIRAASHPRCFEDCLRDSY